MTDCVFCRLLADELPAVKVHDDALTLAFMDIFPLRHGHVLVIPKHHAAQLKDLPENYRAALIDTASRISSALYASPLKPDAVHFVINDGPAAHQTVPHVHMHVLPRHAGDGAGFVLKLLRKPLDLALGPTPAQKLEAIATALRQSLAKS